jgi:hypothetical protein
LKDEIEKKNQFNKKIKRLGTKYEIITYHKLRLKDEIEKKSNFLKRVQKKNKKSKK